MEQLSKYPLLIVGIIIVIVFFMFDYKKIIKEGFDPLYWSPIEPWLRYIGTIFSSTLPQKTYSLFARYDILTGKYTYFYLKANNFYDHDFVELKIDYDLYDGSKIKIDDTGNEYTVNLQNSYLGQIRDYNIYSRYAKTYGFNPVLNLYQPDLYTRPVHYGVGGEFDTTMGKYGLLVPIKDEKTKEINSEGTKYVILEKEIRPEFHEYAYYVIHDNKLIDLGESQKLVDGNFVKIPNDKQLYMLKVTELF